MKKFFKSFVLIAAAALTLSACSQKEMPDTATPGDEITLKFNIRNADDANVSKALLGTENGKNFLNWENGDLIGTFSVGSFSGNSTTSNNNSGTVEVSGDTYTLNVQVYNTGSITNIYSYYPHSVTAGKDKTSATVTIPEAQTMNANGFDADAMPMAGAPVEVNLTDLAANTDTPCGDINFSNLGSIIKFRVYSSVATSETLTSVKFVTTDNIGGNFTIDLTGVDASDETSLALTATSNTVNTITTSYPSHPAIGTGADNAIDVYMVVAPGTYSGTQVVVTTNLHTYTLTASGEKTFTRSHVKPMKVDIQNGTQGDLPMEESWEETTLANLTSSDIFVIVGTNATASYAMTNDNGTSNPPAAAAVTISDNKITSAVASNMKWNISGDATNGYTFYPNGSTTTWLYCTATNNGVRVGNNDNKAFTIDSNYLYNTATSRYVGIYQSQDWRCYTSINSNITGQSFSFYKRVLSTPDTRVVAPISWSDDYGMAELTDGGTDYVLPSLVNNENLTVTYSSSDDAVASINASTGEVTALKAGTTTISAKYTGTDLTPYKTNTVSYTLDVTDSRTPSTHYYIKVTSTDDITSGDYLIVYETNNVAFDGGLETLDAVSNTISVTISDNKIESTTTTDAAKFTIDVTAGTILSASGNYIGVSSNSNGLKTSTTASTYTNTFAIDNDGNATITANFSDSIMTLRFNKAQDQNRFRYFKNAGQQAIQLYKYN
jgi:hypothetical protein